MRTVPALLIAAFLTQPAFATPMDDRSAAFEILSQRSNVERKFSNCRWIRGMRDDALLARWRKDNAAVVDPAMVVIEAQGGLTRSRGKTVEGLAEMTLGDAVGSREACRTFLEEARRGAHDLTTLVQAPTLRRVLSYAPPAGDAVTWTVEQRRLPTGVLAYTARRWTGEGGVPACEAETATRPHIHLRTRFGADMQPVVDPDPDMWFAECVDSPVDPVTGVPSRDPA